MDQVATVRKIRFADVSGYVVAPPEAGHRLLTVGHTAQVKPWTDPDVHQHAGSEEGYILLAGCLWLQVAGSVVSLKRNELLMVWPGVPHAIVGGEGPIEHLGLRAPALRDRRPVGDLPASLPPVDEEGARDLRRAWGYRVSLQDPQNQSCWLVGAGRARFPSSHLSLAYLDFPTTEAANAGIGTRHRMHLHRESWETYVVLEGVKTLRVEEEMVTLRAGELLQVPPGVRHTLAGRQAPYRGFTLRVPALDHSDKVED
jgi:mannose-6-phosphate isomerase-like protein (cupin superfamily)